MSVAPFRRIVTGHDANGKAIIQEDGPPPRVQRLGGEHGPMFYEVWSTYATPAPIDRASGEPQEDEIDLVPPKNGTRIRVCDFPPEGDNIENMTVDEARRHFEEIGAVAAFSHSDSAPRHPFMHRCETIDYGIILQGEITLVMDNGEVTAGAGDIVVQRGTNHAWANRTNENCRIAFVLIDGRFARDLL